MPSKTKRLDKDGSHRKQFDANKKRIYATQNTCGICGKPVDFSFKYPHPLSPCIDHIVPVSKGGHPSDIENLQLAHMICNSKKSNTLIGIDQNGKPELKKTPAASNRDLPKSIDWEKYRAS